MSEALGKIDPDYKKYVNAVLAKVQLNMSKNLGYALVSGDKIIGYKEVGKKKNNNEYYLTNNTNSPKLVQELTELSHDDNHAFFGFMLIVFYSVYTARGRSITLADLLNMIRKVDKRFPSTLVV